MKTIHILFLVSLFALFSCEEVITVDVDNAEPTLVIEGRVTTLEGPHEVRLSMTNGYFDYSDYVIIDNATITISDNATPANTEVLTYNAEKKIYQTSDTYKGVDGRKYTLNVEHNGSKYMAEDHIIPCPQMDSIVIGTSIEDVEEPAVYGFSPIDLKVQRYLKWEIYFNNEKNFMINLADCDIFDKDKDYVESFSVYSYNEEDDENKSDDDKFFNTGSVVKAVQLTLTKDVYDFYQDFGNQLSAGKGMFSSPISDIQGNVWKVDDEGKKISRVYGIFMCAGASFVEQKYSGVLIDTDQRRLENRKK